MRKQPAVVDVHITCDAASEERCVESLDHVTSDPRSYKLTQKYKDTHCNIYENNLQINYRCTLNCCNDLIFLWRNRKFRTTEYKITQVVT